MNNFIMSVLLLLIAASYYLIDPVFVTVAQNANPDTQSLNEEESSFNLWWLVPLLLIPPILYFMAKSGDDRDGYDDQEALPGIKTNTGRRSSSFEKNSLSRPAYFSEISRSKKKPKNPSVKKKTHKNKKS